MKRLFQALMVAAMVLSGGALARADQAKPTQADAEALALKAAAFIQAHGIKQARAAFDKPGEFYHGELYAGVVDFTGNWVVYPPKPAAEGSNIFDVRDSDGKYLTREVIDTARKDGQGWVEYRWLNPAVNQIQPKITYVKLVPGTNLVTYVGIYK